MLLELQVCRVLHTWVCFVLFCLVSHELPHCIRRCQLGWFISGSESLLLLVGEVADMLKLTLIIKYRPASLVHEKWWHDRFIKHVFLRKLMFEVVFSFACEFRNAKSDFGCWNMHDARHLIDLKVISRDRPSSLAFGLSLDTVSISRIVMKAFCLGPQLAHAFRN